MVKGSTWTNNMGVTIHFEGRLKSEKVYEDLLALTSAIANAQKWLTEAIEPTEKTLLRVRDEEEWDYTGPVKGIIVRLDEDCDPLRLEFDRDLYIQEFVKTQFAGVQCHLRVIDLLKSIQPLFHELKVEDEGEYWETEDLATLETHVETVREVIEEELRKNPAAQLKFKTPEGRIIDLLK
jgi:hypothetical protein